MARTTSSGTHGARKTGYAESARLEAIASLVPEGSGVVADIGSGHGRLPRLLLSTRRAGRCIAGEKPGPTAQALARLPRTEGLHVRTGDGLAVLRPDDEVDIVVAAGMGGRTIAAILERGRDRIASVRRVVLQPQRDWSELRSRLYALGLAIVAERLVHDRNRFYLVLAAEPRTAAELPEHDSLTPGDLLEAGPCLVRSADPEVGRYWTEQLRRLESILERAPQGAGRDAAERDRDRALRVLAAIDSSRSRRPGPLI